MNTSNFSKRQVRKTFKIKYLVYLGSDKITELDDDGFIIDENHTKKKKRPITLHAIPQQSIQLQQSPTISISDSNTTPDMSDPPVLPNTESNDPCSQSPPISEESVLQTSFDSDFDATTNLDDLYEDFNFDHYDLI